MTPEDPKQRAARWRQERREVAELRARIIVLMPGRADGSHAKPPVVYVYKLVRDSDAQQRKCGAKPLSARKLRKQQEADDEKLKGMSQRVFDNHVSAARNSSIPFSILLENEHNTWVEMASGNNHPKAIEIRAALWAEHAREKAKLMTAASNASKFRTGRRKGAKGRAK